MTKISSLNFQVLNFIFKFFRLTTNFLKFKFSASPPVSQVQVNVARLVLSSHCTHTDEMLARGKCGVDTYKKARKKRNKKSLPK